MLDKIIEYARLAHYYIDASAAELREDGLTRSEVLAALRAIESQIGCDFFLYVPASSGSKKMEEIENYGKRN